MAEDLSWKEAIVEVLRGADAPLHYAEIANQISERKLRRGLTATPAATVAATIAMSLKNERAKSPFARAQRGFYQLRGSYAPTESLSTAEETADEAAEATGVVNALGMFWSRAKVVWELRPRLLGQQQAGALSVDFCDEKGVYLLHDLQGVVYVGRVGDQLGRRLYQHTIDRLSGRWDRFSWFGVYGVSQDGSLKTDADFSNVDVDVIIATMEAVLIEGLEPRQNRKRGDEFQAVEFLQLEDPELQNRRKQEWLQEIGRGLKNR